MGRFLPAADLDGDGKLEVVATTTQTQAAGAQVFVFNSTGAVFQPPGLGFTAWPRYNTASGAGNDADVNGNYGRSHLPRPRPTGSQAKGLIID